MTDQEVIRGHMGTSPDGRVHTMFALFDYHPLSLKDWLRGFRVDGPAVLPLAVFVPKALQVMRALRVLELRNVLHRDVKPDNLLVQQDGYVCLCDFGEAYFMVRPLLELILFPVLNFRVAGCTSCTTLCSSPGE